MPWTETCVMDQRLEFIHAWRQTGSVANASRLHGISRVTAYKWIERYTQEGEAGLLDRSRRPEHSPQALDARTRDAVLSLRRRHPTWGPKKLVVLVRDQLGLSAAPAASTVGDLLKREGLVQSVRRRRRGPVPQRAWSRGTSPNEVWCVDYKGEFKLGNGRYCYPLTISDESSRYLFACQGFPGIRGADVEECFQALFQEYGLPTGIRSDNGSPFASTGLARLSRLSAWWLRLGIALERIAPGHPEQNGCHERMHRDLKAETTRPPGRHLEDQQQRFDHFRHLHNHLRPHEALGQQTPASRYRPSSRPYPTRIAEPEYPGHYEVRRVCSNGCIRFRGDTVFISHALAGQAIGLNEEADGEWAVYYAALCIGILDARMGTIDHPRPDEDDDCVA